MFLYLRDYVNCPFRSHVKTVLNEGVMLLDLRIKRKSKSWIRINFITVPIAVWCWYRIKHNAARSTLVMIVATSVRKVQWSAKQNLDLNPIGHSCDHLKRMDVPSRCNQISGNSRVRLSDVSGQTTTVSSQLNYINDDKVHCCNSRNRWTHKWNTTFLFHGWCPC